MASTLPSTMPLAELLFALLFDSGVRDIVIAPGSRSAPLTLAAVRHGGFRLRLVYDERSAAYTALGIAQQTQTPACVLCSSGTAALNFGPAIAEAYYQQIPLLCLTADRPPEWIDQIDNQALRQTRLFGEHVRGFFSYPMDDGAADTRWHAARTVADAFAVLQSQPRGPVHINVPLREPLYHSSMQVVPDDSRLRRPVRTAPVSHRVDDATMRELASIWRAAKRKLIVAGQLPPDATLQRSLNELQQDPSVVVIGDITSNLYGADDTAMPHWEAAIYTHDAEQIASLMPDLAIWIGGQVTSKTIKTLLRKRAPAHFWRVDPGVPAADAFQANTMVVPAAARDFMAQLVEAVTGSKGLSADSSHSAFGDYAKRWRAANSSAAALLRDLLAQTDYCELTAAKRVLDALPRGSTLQIGNSMPIRLVNLLGISVANLPLRIDANRGVSGIDGTVSTAVGAASTTDTLATLIVGDLGFFYDRNGLWQTMLPPNLRIVLLNNHGGGIFDVIDGPDTLAIEERQPWFLTPNPLRAERTAADFGLRYRHATDFESLDAALHDFFVPDGSPALLEIETDMQTNSLYWRKTLACLRGRTPAPIVPHDNTEVIQE